MPEIGRFLKVDPMREFVNPYSYTANSPIMYLDPNGEQTEILIGGPYKNHLYGHVALRVFGYTEDGTRYDCVYDFGRYGKTWGFQNSKGEGQLRVG